jgi:large subunit ribosomal protein L24
MKLKKGDTVKVLIGKDKGKTGKIQKIFAKKNQILVAGINLFKKHQKPQGKNPGGIIDIQKPLLPSKVAFLCPKCNRQTRIGSQSDKSGEKVRICRKCKQMI